MQKEENEEILN